jgi:hypothetical protein
VGDREKGKIMCENGTLFGTKLKFFFFFKELEECEKKESWVRRKSV